MSADTMAWLDRALDDAERRGATVTRIVLTRARTRGLTRDVLVAFGGPKEAFFGRRITAYCGIPVTLGDRDELLIEGMR